MTYKHTISNHAMRCKPSEARRAHACVEKGGASKPDTSAIQTRRSFAILNHEGATCFQLFHFFISMKTHMYTKKNLMQMFSNNLEKMASKMTTQMMTTIYPFANHSETICPPFAHLPTIRQPVTHLPTFTYD